ncbi:uncharacterized protein LOC123507382 [Portunus trituberculatus]|uniref:uncharacterized protein LOC123507382 n=1 Tax=Portunus trituberculatus TaxID=210409 RepID=UPI001E1D0AF3|nr:uncharacterized protein LOC123507382 [Portunus trituberculatus]
MSSSCHPTASRSAGSPFAAVRAGKPPRIPILLPSSHFQAWNSLTLGKRHRHSSFSSEGSVPSLPSAPAKTAMTAASSSAPAASGASCSRGVKMDCTTNPASTFRHTRFSSSASRVPAPRSSRHSHAVLPAAAAIPSSAPASSFSPRSVAPAAPPLASTDRPFPARTDLSDTVCTAPSPSSSPEECQNDGFTLVTRTKRDRRRPPLPAQENAPPSANRSSLLPRAARPSVGVSRAQRSQANFPAFRVPAQEGFGTSYDAVAALEEEYSHLHMQNIIGRDGSTVLLPQDEDTYNTLHTIASDQEAFLDIMELSPDSQLTKGIVMGYPLRMPPFLLRHHPQVEEATRCVTPRDREETRQVLVSVRGPLPTQIDLGNWGVFYLRPYTPEPLRCYRCQRFGHHQANCSRPSVCGICSGLHETRQCLTRYKVKQVVTHKCPNCGQGHHAWNTAFPARQQRVVQGRVRQVQWVQDQQRAAMTPAPPGTFVWGQQRSIPDNTSPQLTQQDFSPLVPTASQLPSSQRPPQSPNGTNRLAPTKPPAPPRDSIPVTKDLLRSFAKEVSLAMGYLFSTIAGATFDLQAFNKATDVVSSKIAEKMIRQAEELTAPAPQASVQPVPSPRVRAPPASASAHHTTKGTHPPQPLPVSGSVIGTAVDSASSCPPC